ncbi:MAG: hypothetical protein AAFY66_19620 [Pseudomonadota bacterium]
MGQDLGMGQDLARAGVVGDAQFAPGSALFAVLEPVPLTGALELEPGAVEDKIGERFPPGSVHVDRRHAAPAREHLWSGTLRSNSISAINERTNPSVRRSGRRDTVANISTVSFARSENRA